MEQFKYYNHLGFHNPYYFRREDGTFFVESSLEKVLELQKEKTLDFTAIVEILSTGYAFGDRTLLKEIKKTPWMAMPSKNNSRWDFESLPPHGENKVPEEESSVVFYRLLERELLEYVDEHQHIGILLTGGMDSRIVAAVLQNLLKTGKLSEKKVTAYTWGKDDCRDVVYAKRIAGLFGWNWKHLVVDQEQMRTNFNLVIENGCEFTPIHLHAMSKIAEETELDCILAGSFGDSIGRGEYSSVKVRDLKSIDKEIKNVCGILRDDLFEASKREIEADLLEYHRIFPAEQVYQQNERDLQLHYMRRMLNSCMNVINMKIPLYQLFSSPSVFGYIWSIVPERRTDVIYKILLEKYSPELLSIPWARTGLIYPETTGTPDNFSKSHHDYGEMIRRYFLNEIECKIDSNIDLVRLIFNYDNLKQLIKNCKKYPLPNSFSYEEKLMWVAALLEFIISKKISLKLPPNNSKSNRLMMIKGNLSYMSRYFYKKIRS